MDEKWWARMTEHQWVIGDSRTGTQVGMECFPTEETAARTIAGYRERDARGKRQDVHHLMPFLVPLQVR